MESLPRSQARSPQRPPPRLNVVYRPIAALKLDPKNPRQHSLRQVRQIARSIKAFGFNVPVLIDSNLNVIAGHGRLLGCRELGLTEVPPSRGIVATDKIKLNYTLLAEAHRTGLCFLGNGAFAPETNPAKNAP